MIHNWIDFLLDIPGVIIDFLEGCELWMGINLLHILIVVAVAGIITHTFLSVARR